MKSTDEKGDKKKAPGVEIFRRINRLKLKITGSEDGPDGQISPDAIAKANEKIQALCADCPVLLKTCLDHITKNWAAMRDMLDGPERDTLAGKIFTSAHEIKDVGSMCGFELLAHFAESLRDYIIKTDLSHKAHSVIVQAHIDAMSMALRDDIRDSGNIQAEELKLLVHKAIYKYS